MGWRWGEEVGFEVGKVRGQVEELKGLAEVGWEAGVVVE